MEIFGIPVQALMGQLLIGLINGSFYALLSLGLAVIFGMLNIINFAHGAQYMLGAFAAYLLLAKLGMNYWWALLVVPPLVGAFGMLIERTMLKPLYKLDHIYGLLLTFGLALILEGLFRNEYGASGLPYAIPPQLGGGTNLGFMFLPNYRGWVIVASLVICLATSRADAQGRGGSDDRRCPGSAEKGPACCALIVTRTVNRRVFLALGTVSNVILCIKSMRAEDVVSYRHNALACVNYAFPRTFTH